MKRLMCCAAACLLLLSACTAKEEQVSFDPSATAQAVLDSGAFSETLEQLDTQVAVMLFGLEGAAEDYEGSVVYYSTGATSEIVAVIQTEEEGDTETVAQTLQTWVDSQVEATRDYQPAEVEKLEHAILEQRGTTVLLVVAADWETAAQAVPGE